MSKQRLLTFFFNPQYQIEDNSFIDSRMQFIKKEWLTFKLDAHHKIIIQLNINTAIECCDQADVYFVRYHQKILISCGTINEDIEYFINSLACALNQEHQFYQNHDQNIGYLWNFIWNKKNKNDQYSNENQIEREKLLPYLAFGNNIFAAWIYNDEHNNIIFTITPVFKSWLPRRKQPKYNTFVAWMKKTYKPIFTRIISNEIADEWYHQATKINQVIKHNIETFGILAEERHNKKIAETKANGTYEALMAEYDAIAKKQKEFELSLKNRNL